MLAMEKWILTVPKRKSNTKSWLGILLFFRVNRLCLGKTMVRFLAPAERGE